MRRVRASVVAFATLAALGASPAMAQNFGEDGGFDPTLGFFRVEPTPPVGVPDREGCVKICFRDLSPCDPPQFKRVDARCRNKDA